jgi:actin related protein 2/3 complex subunit 1A/1B
VADPARNSVTTIKTPCLPFMALVWLSYSSIMAVGYDCCPILFSYNGTQLQMVEKFDQQGRKATTQAAGPAALNKFRQMDSRGQSSSDQTSTELSTVHQNTITCVSLFLIFITPSLYIVFV